MYQKMLDEASRKLGEATKKLHLHGQKIHKKSEDTEDTDRDKAAIDPTVCTNIRSEKIVHIPQGNGPLFTKQG